MAKIIPKQISILILAVMVMGLLNLCLVTLQAKAAAPILASEAIYMPQSCSLTHVFSDGKTIKRPSSPIPSCCLERASKYDAVVRTDNDKSVIVAAVAAVTPAVENNLDNFSSNITSFEVYPPPAQVSPATTVIRE